MSKPFDYLHFDLSLPGPLFLIEANAGTGKTYNIQKLFRRFIEETPTAISQLLVVTFTEAATAELRDRIRTELTEAARDTSLPAEALNRVRLALASFDEAAISTIHGFCQRALRQFAFESGVPFECQLSPDDASLRQEAVRDFYAAQLLRDGSCPVPLASLNAFAAKLLAEPPPRLEADAADPAQAGETLLAAVRHAAATPPKRASGFKDALAALQPELNGPDALAKVLAETNLFTTTAKDSAPIKDAKATYDGIPALKVYRDLQRYLTDEQTGVEARRKRAAVFSFNDLLTQMRRALADNPESPLAKMLRATYKVVLVDEFQDTDPTQYAIFSTAFNYPGWKLFMIGDPKQAIYAFRGGDLATYLRAREQVPETNRYTLANNFRADRAMIESVNALFAPNRAFLDSAIGYVPSACGEKDKGELLKNGKPLAHPFQMTWYRGDENGKSVAKGNCLVAFLREAVNAVVSLLNDPAYTFRPKDEKEARRLQPSDIAILADTNGGCQSLHDLLRDRGVPAVIYRSGNVFDSSDARDLAFILDAILNSSRMRTFRSALLTPWCGMTYADVIKEDSLTTLQEQVGALAPVWRQSGVAAAVAKFMALVNGYENIASRPNAERHLVNERQLVELLNQQEHNLNLPPEAVLNFLRSSISDPPRDETYEERLESDSEAVTIMTIHKSKGLEFPIVFCPTLVLQEHKPNTSGFYTTHDDGGNLILPLGHIKQNESLPTAARETFAEKLRLIYVAVTRPAHACILLAGKVKYGRGANFKNALNYLGELQRNPASEPGINSLSEPVPWNVPWLTFVDKPASAFGELPGLYHPADVQKTDWREPPAAPTVANTFAVMSYSGMVQHGGPESLLPAGGSDEAAAPATGVPAAADPLPKGKHAGLAVHETFEHIDFTNPSRWTESAERSLSHYALLSKDRDERIARVMALAASTLGTPLPGLGFRLNEIPFGDTRREWTFFFPVTHAVKLDLFTADGLAFTENAGRRDGFLTGSIDLMFRKDGRYYFADWKTDTLDDYSPDALGREMIARGYRFQAIVYSLALYERLKTTLPDFDFARDFGGGFYCFVRGIADSRGIYRFNPTESELLAWRDCFREVTK